MLADRRMVSIRQQSDILKSSLGNEIAASPSTVYRQREKVRKRALAESENLLKTACAIQLCYDGCMVDKLDRYIFLGQFYSDADKKMHES